MELPEEFHLWTAESRASHLMSVRSRVLKWNRHDVFQARFGHFIDSASSIWWFFAAATLLGATYGMQVEWFTGTWGIVFERSIDLGFVALGWKLSDWWR